jgi:hypothetical protein
VSGDERIIVTDQAAANGNDSVGPDRRMTAFVANPVLANSLWHPVGKQNCRQFKDLRLDVKEIQPALAGMVLAILISREPT